jgi:hypothetical protein
MPILNRPTRRTTRTHEGSRSGGFVGSVCLALFAAGCGRAHSPILQPVAIREDARIQYARSLIPDVKFTVPIEVQRKSKENKARWGGPNGTVPRAWVASDHSRIVVGDWSDIYHTNPQALAAALAHEQYHIDHNGDASPEFEIPAYEYQLQILKSLNGRDPEVEKALEAQRMYQATFAGGAHADVPHCDR